jgi:coenzyme Q-binding protein COQ10
MPTHAERRTIAYSDEQLFDLVADVGRYPEFLPWCAGARVRTRTDTELVADLTIGFGPFRETFTSRVTLERPRRVQVRYERGPFRYLNNSWTFTPERGGCLVDFFVEFEFRSRLLQAAIGVVFNEAVKLMVGAFLRRARDIYGPPRTTLPATGAAEPASPQRPVTEGSSP